MKLLRFVNAGVLSLLLAGSTAVFAQQDKNEEVKPPHQPEPKPESKEEEKPRKDEAKPPKQDEAKPPKDAKPKHEESNAPREQDKQDAKERPEQREAQHGRPAGKSARIPDDKFREHFGREHTVVISRPVIVEGRPRFQSGGYWFVIVDPWPAEWTYSDEVYVDYVDGDYFLYDLLHPGFRVALFVSM